MQTRKSRDKDVDGGGVPLPAQHCVRLRCEDGWVDDKTGVVHDQRDSLRGPHVAAPHGCAGPGLLGVLVNKHHLSDSQAFEGALVAGQAAGAAAHHPAAAGATGRDPLGTGTAGPGRRASISLAVCTQNNGQCLKLVEFCLKSQLSCLTFQKHIQHPVQSNL